LEENGFELKRIKWSHRIFYHQEAKKITVVPIHTKELPIWTALAIIKQSWFESKDFLEFIEK